MKSNSAIPRLALLLATLALPAPAATLERSFAQPPEATKPWCYWYWISDNMSKEGITRDLEAMARVGIGEAFVGNIFLDEVPAGKTKVLSEGWWQLVEHAIREGGRVGVNVGMFNCPGWSQSGGPWIKPEQSMRYLVSSETKVKGPTRFDEKLPAPKQPFQDVSVLAFPAPKGEAESTVPKLVCQPPAEGAEKLVDGNPATALTFPKNAGQGNSAFTVDLEYPAPITARSLSLLPSEAAWAGQCELQFAGGDGSLHTVRAFKFDRSNMSINVGPMPRGPVTISFAAVTARQFRLVFTRVGGKGALAEIALSPAAKVESFVEKQLGKMHPTPLPMWDTYLWPASQEPNEDALSTAPEAVVDLSAKLQADGRLVWDVPTGDWIILRTGMTPTGTRNSPASPEGQGLEVDKMNRAAAKAHFEAYIGQLLKRMPAGDRKAFRRVVADSYEMGSENWTDGFAQTFQARYGYDPKPWLPVLTGRVVGSADRSDRFLWDLRRLVADHVAADYVGGLRDLCHPHGLQLWLENYGHWGFPAEFLQYGGQADRVSGEYWVTGDLGSIELRAASSCANTYGKPIVSAESFTGGPAFQTAPWGLKARGDWAFCEGVNHFVLHVNIQQPWEDRKPGINAWFGTEFNRHNTWFEPGKAWIDYLRRSCFLLQQGWRVADAAYYIGEDAPKMTGIRQPSLPSGRDFDYINAEVVEKSLGVRNGRLVLPHGTEYPLLVLPELATMRPEVLRKIRSLIKDGATVLGQPPARSPSLAGYPGCDEEVRKIAAEIWGDLPAQTGKGAGTAAKNIGPGGERKFGKGRVLWGKKLDEVLNGIGLPADFVSGVKLRYTHRAAGNMHIYFVANPEAQAVATTAGFRVRGLAPELWHPETGRIEHPAVYDATADCTRLPLQLGPHGSVFVVFREKASANRIVSVAREGQLLLDTRAKPSAPKDAEAEAGVTNDFTLAIWAKPAADTTILREANKAVSGMAEPRNDVVFPPHGNTFSDGVHAGCGFSVGRNGVAVFEHGANYFAPVLVHPAALSNWTHVAVVYRHGQANLYLDGALARQGLQSDYAVHPPAALGGGGAPFRGELGALEIVPRALTPTEVADLARVMPRPSTPPPAGIVELTFQSKGGLQAMVRQTGQYELTAANGKKHALGLAEVPEPIQVAGPWDVRFSPGWGAPETATFTSLEDWTKRPEEGIRHYSGTAVYRTALDLPESLFQDKNCVLCLDLGKVRDLATVRVNGRGVGTLWLAPWRIDISAAARPGRNQLEIEVVNTWNNRLVGDATLPADKRLTYLSVAAVNKNAPLLPAGLLGPVTVRAEKVLVFPSR